MCAHLCGEAVNDQHHVPRPAPAQQRSVAYLTLSEERTGRQAEGQGSTYAFVFHAPEQSSPLCCLMRLPGLTVNLFSAREPDQVSSCSNSTHGPWPERVQVFPAGK
jgi:hypothetical protein